MALGIKRSWLLDLPGDIWGKIFGLFPVRDLIRLSLTCTKIRSAVHGKANIEVSGNSCSVFRRYKMFRGIRFNVESPDDVCGLVREMEENPQIVRLIASLSIKIGGTEVSKILRKLDSGSLVHLRVGNVLSGDEKSICRLTRLEKLYIRDAETFRDGDLVRLVKLTDLTLTGDAPMITSHGLSQLKNLTRLSVLALTSLTFLSSTKIKHLSLWNRHIGSNDWMYMTRVTRLRVAGQIYSVKISGGIGQLNRLRDLAFYGVDEVDIREIRELKLISLQLFSVRFSQENISEGSANIWDFTEWNLETIGLRKFILSTWDFIKDKLLLPLTLRKLEISYGYLADLMISNNLSNLTSLVLGCSHDHKKIKHRYIGALINLRELCLNSTAKIYNADVVGLTNLTHLVMNDTITDHGIAGLTEMRRLVLNSLVTDRGISRMRKLRFMDLNYNVNVTDRGLVRLTKLTEINLRMNKNISNVSLKKLMNLEKVEVEFSAVRFNFRWLEGNGVHVVWNYAEREQFLRLFPDMCKGKVIKKIDRFSVEFERFDDYNGVHWDDLVMLMIFSIGVMSVCNFFI
ncbi:MAG: hypothetical protein Hyperionvirus4_147 [Hyperionvirus sp.]|uniref:F-box domain-containing protein n=1 Tax=Hyperionvirus sp. TaxID=2487770 RepID=A0A3G5A806_9VIRU|nr:MAG: hypothetical protein Hyperionvirus4_147 [Hyperionvirus sp.]